MAGVGLLGNIVHFPLDPSPIIGFPRHSLVCEELVDVVTVANVDDEDQWQHFVANLAAEVWSKS